MDACEKRTGGMDARVSFIRLYPTTCRVLCSSVRVTGRGQLSRIIGRLSGRAIMNQYQTVE